jgi:hypothetical protein
LLHLVNEAMLPINAPGPTPTQFVLQRLWLAQPHEGFSLRLSNQAKNAECLGPILFHPPGKILERRNIKFQASQ